MMKSVWKRSGRWFLLALCAAALLGSCTTAPKETRLPQHVVLLWLKHPERAGDRAQLIRAANSMRVIPGVVRVDAGRSAPAGAGTDHSFDLAVAITFQNVAALQRYEVDPRRRAAMKRYLGPLVRHYEVYDLGVR